LPDEVEGRSIVDVLGQDDPSFVGPYRLLGRLGVGGMGRVYLARSPAGTFVAVKVVHAAYAGDAMFRQRFAREVAAARHVEGPYTVAVLDADTQADQPWLATSYIRTYSLTDTVVRHGPLPEPMVRQLGAGLAAALQSVHVADVVHRDVKPSNVLMAAEGPRLVDFGVSRAADATTLTSTGQVVGSAGYMSPEQIDGHHVGSETDIFSLGAVLVFALTGVGPFGEGSAASLLYRVVHGTPAVPTTTDPDLANTIARCLAKDPASRPTTSAILDALGPVPTAAFIPADWLPDPVPVPPSEPVTEQTATQLKVRPQGQHPPPAVPPARSRRRRGVAIAGGVLAVLLLVGAAYALESARPGRSGAAGTNTARTTSSSQGSTPTPTGTGLRNTPISVRPRPTLTTIVDPDPGVKPPAMPTGLTAAATGTSTILLHWMDNSNNESEFTVLNGDESRTVAANATSFAWTGLGPGTYMCFAIAARNSGGYSATYPNADPYWVCTSSLPTATTTTATPSTPQLNPAAPPSNSTYGVFAYRHDLVHVDTTSGGSVNVAYLPGCVGHASATPTLGVNWHGEGGPLRIFFAADFDGRNPTLIVRKPDGTWSCNDDAGFGRNPFLEFPTAPDGTYTVWVGKYSSSAASIQGRLFATSENYDPDHATPRAPSSLTATPVNSTTVHFQWTDESSDESLFVIDADYDGLKTIAANSTTYDWNNVPVGISTCFNLVSQNDAGSSRRVQVCLTMPS
jgi:serine/threonine protein kinase